MWYDRFSMCNLSRNLDANCQSLTFPYFAYFNTCPHGIIKFDIFGNELPLYQEKNIETSQEI